jgi:acetyl esterase/lipase
MPSLHAKIVNFILYVIRMKRTVNRMKERVESGERTYTEPTKKHHQKHNISTHEVNGHQVWTMAPKDSHSGRYIIYLHGGAYVNSFSSQHWEFMSKLIDALNCTVIAPNYPHAPEHYVHDVFAMLLPLYEELTERVDHADVILMGDSSGGGISLALAQRLREDGLAQPGRLVLLSPFLDATLSNPEILEVDKIDPFMGIRGLKYGGEVYARDVDPKHYLVSPVFGSFRSLAPISLFIGTRDILMPDCRLLRDKARSEGVEIDYREYPGMIHDWMLGPLPESKQVLKEIVAIVGPVCQLATETRH